MIIPTAEPFFFPGNNIGCLLVHGFTGAPKEMRWMGEDLARRGYTTLGVRLAGHATSIDDLGRMKWQDWLGSVEDGYCMLRGCTDKVFVIGLSMGGILSLVFSSRHSIAGLVTMSVPYSLPNDPRLPFLNLLSGVIRTVDKGVPDWRNPEGAEGHIEYPRFPTKGLIQLRDLLQEMRSILPKVHAPALIIHSKRDGSVPSGNAEKIFAELGSRTKELMWVENSGHVIPREPDRQNVFNKVDEFIRHIHQSI